MLTGSCPTNVVGDDKPRETTVFVRSLRGSEHSS